jgi:pimeloyl-ACP methyl ester carboxylesterase
MYNEDMIHKTEKRHTMRYNKTTLRYWTYGNPKKPVLILVHGITGTHRGFYKIIPHLVDNFFIIAPDLPGFGESTTDQSLSISCHAEILNSFIENLKLKTKPFIVGHSYGTLVVAQAVHIAPELSQPRTMLISPVPSAVKLFEKRQIGRLGVELHYTLGKLGRVGNWWLKRKIIARIITITLITAKNPELRKEIHQEHFRNLAYIKNPKELHRLFKEIHKSGVDKLAPHIKKKILIVTGTHDSSTPFHEQKKLEKRLKDGALLSIKQVGHLTHYESPRSLAKAMIVFFK